MEELLQKMSKNGIEYKASDLKTEIHFLGQIVGATNLTEDEGLFCEAFFEAGDKWKCLSANPTIQTQTSYADVIILFNLSLFRFQILFVLLIRLICTIRLRIYSDGLN
jgi:hypothetical protein